MSAVFNVEQDYVLLSRQITIIASALDEDSLEYLNLFVFHR